MPHPDTVATPHDCELNLPSWGWRDPEEATEAARETAAETAPETAQFRVQTPPLLLSAASLPRALNAQLPALSKLAVIALTALLLGTWIGFRVGVSQRPITTACYRLECPPEYRGHYYQRFCS